MHASVSTVFPAAAGSCCGHGRYLGDSDAWVDVTRLHDGLLLAAAKTSSVPVAWR